MATMESLTAVGAEMEIPADEQTEANRSLPDGIREALQRLLDEYARMEEQRQQASLNEARLHARIAQLEKQLKLDEKARTLLANRVAMLEYALKERRQATPEDSAANSSREASAAAAADKKGVPNEQLLSPGDDGRKAGFASADNKYKTLPSNFLASSRDAKMMSPGRRMLWKYLEELGYMTNGTADNSAAATSSPTIHVAQPEVTVSPPPPEESAVESKPKLAVPEMEDHGAMQAKMENMKKPGRDSMKLRTKTSAGAGSSYSFAWTALSEDALDANTTWKPKMTLLHHLDSVRAVAFHDSEVALLSGSEDGTVKLWNVDVDRAAKRGQPVHTFHGHRDIVTSVAVRADISVAASCSVDGVVYLWNLPSLDNDPYDDLGCSSKYSRAMFSDHTDAVWDVHFSPKAPILFSAGADGRVHLWRLGANESEPLLRSLLHGKDDIPVSVRTMGCDASKALVAYTSGDVVQFDVESGKSLRVLSNPDKARLSCIRSHPHFPLAFASGADNSISYFDVNAGSCVHRMLAHAQAVTSLSVSADGNAMVSSCHDSSIRFWDVAKRICVQDLSAHQTHRRKYSEGIHAVAYHPSLPYVASGGADCAIKVYQS